MALLDPGFLEITTHLDVDAFWAENDLCHGYRQDKPRCALSFSPDDHWIFEFVEVPSTIRYYHDRDYRNFLHKEVNAFTRRYVGKAFFEEDTWEHQPKRIENLFGCEFTYLEGGTPWLTPVTGEDGDADPDLFNRILDHAESVDLRYWALPEPFRQEWEERSSNGSPLPKLGTGSRGPATIMTSILPPETFFYWVEDHPGLMERFRNLLADRMVALNQILREFSGNDEPGWWITDDNCALFNQDLYERFCMPVLEQVLSAFAPGHSRRYQHSDSAMGHLMAQQGQLGINDVNYGPTVDAGLIRRELPNAYIRGQMPPMLLRDGRPEEIKERVISDFAKAGTGGGLEITTAGSLAAGTGLGRMRWFMQIVQDVCRYKKDSTCSSF